MDLVAIFFILLGVELDHFGVTDSELRSEKIFFCGISRNLDLFFYNNQRWLVLLDNKVLLRYEKTIFAFESYNSHIIKALLP